MAWASSLLHFVLLFSTFILTVFAGEKDHKYTENDPVTLWVNSVGAYNNPLETYPYYSLPFCKPNTEIQTKRRSHNIGEILEGNELRNSGYDIKFKNDAKDTNICSMTLSEEDAATFNHAITNNYFFQMYLDDLPIWGMLGQQSLNQENQIQSFIFTHRVLTISYNEDRIIEVDLNSHEPVLVAPGSVLNFRFSVYWISTDKSFENRFDKYLDIEFFEHQIHWFSIFNSFMMVIFLCGLVAIILIRTLKKDYSRYMGHDFEDTEFSETLTEDSGWKQIQGDVFRSPNNLELLAAFIGTGWQLVFVVLSFILFAIAGPFHGDVYEERGETILSVITSYALTSVVAGFASGSFYKKYFSTPKAEQDSKWQKAMIYTMTIFPSFIVTVILLLNFVAVYYNTINTIPFVVMVKMFCIWLFISVPLIVVGTIFGRHWYGKNDFPCRVNSVERPIPKSTWISKPLVIIFITGLLPFGSIFIELYFIFTSFWNYKFYYVYGFLLLVYLIMIIVTVCTTIVAVYFILNSENYNWQWLSFFSASSSAFYVMLYAIYYFIFKTQMSGFFQAAFYFGYMLLFCTAWWFLCGAVGFVGSLAFVKKIYSDIKVD